MADMVEKRGEPALNVAKNWLQEVADGLPVGNVVRK